LRVVTPWLIPRKAGDRVKTNRRDALQLARLLRAGELTPVWVPDAAYAAHAAMRELIRARAAAVDDLRRKRQAISSMMRRCGRSYCGKTRWTKQHKLWLQAQRFDHAAQHLVLQDMLLAVQYAQQRLRRTEEVIAEFLPDRSLAPMVEALQALRGIRLVTAATIVAEIGDFRRFETAGQPMSYLGLMPGWAWCPASIPPATRFAAAASPPPATPVSGAR